VTEKLRWNLARDDDAAALFPNEMAMGRHVGRGEYRGMEFLHVNAKRLINTLPSTSPMPFRHTINAYRGCSHACVYCFARPTHTYLNLNVGEDFDRKIVVKVNAVERLKAELSSSKWQGESIAMGTNTDPYQKAEGKYHLTRGIIRVLADAGNPFSILTKSTLVLRDLDLLMEAASKTEVSLAFSIGSLDREVWRKTEPGTPPPDKRIEAVKRLNEAGIPCGVLIAPVLPGISDADDQLREVVEACVQAGSVSTFALGLHLRPGVKDHYFEWLQGAYPDLVPLYASRFGKRAYQSKQVQDDLARRVRVMVGEARRRSSPGPMASLRSGSRRGSPSLPSRPISKSESNRPRHQQLSFVPEDVGS
jgi:DNA repair photolyase